MSKAISLTGNDLTLKGIDDICLRQVPVDIEAGALHKMQSSRQVVEDILRKQLVVYGITTGFGKFKDTVIPTALSRDLQRNLILSHACGVGPDFDEPVVRALMLLRANALVKGYSGIRPEVVKLLLNCLNSSVHPVIPEQGSLGASGDLCPLAHLTLVLIGEGQAHYKGTKVSGKSALNQAGLSPVTLEAKEGLSLINGTQLMSALGALILIEAQKLCKIADIVGAMSLEAQLGSAKPFIAEIQNVRPHPGQQAVAANFRHLLKDSSILASHADCGMVQDAYSLRCIPQVHGATRQAISHALDVFNIEINSATDNPLVFPDLAKEDLAESVVSGGNFHGQPLAIVLDYLAIALAELANISERRTERLVNQSLSNGLPAFLTENGGINSGFMVAQYTAAALVSENKALSHPASVDSIPTSGNQEDHVSMGPIAGRKARAILNNLRRVLAIELLCAAQALDFRLKAQPDHTPGRALQKALNVVRSKISHLDEDRELHLDITAAEKLIASGELLAAVESVQALN
jgi:histidine ammonia-lyase